MSEQSFIQEFSDVWEALLRRRTILRNDISEREAHLKRRKEELKSVNEAIDKISIMKDIGWAFNYVQSLKGSVKT